MAGKGDLKGIAKMAPQIASKTFAYWFWPAMVEEWVTSQYTDDRRGLGEKAILGLLGGAGSTFLYLRELGRHRRDAWPRAWGWVDPRANRRCDECASGYQEGSTA